MILQLDLALVTWVLVINAIGYWLSRTKVKEWVLPIPFILAVVSVVLVSIWGIILNPVGSFAEFISMELHYALPNGLLSAFAATELYDVVHETAKRKPQWQKLWSVVISVFRREKKNG